MTQIQTRATLRLTKRHRRLRTSATMRALVQETRLSPEMFVLPLFVCEGEGVRRSTVDARGTLSVDETVLRSSAQRAKVRAKRSAFPSTRMTSSRPTIRSAGPVGRSRDQEQVADV
jgi:delta-aminolevulinic acid dehydratase/porphobilinogen synthase